MNAATRASLRAVNRRFYDRFATSFSDSRERPWRGWERAIAAIASPNAGEVTVLDVGCGNGRFASFLARSWSHPFRYVGLDSCDKLLRIAAARLDGIDPAAVWRRVDVLEEDLEPTLVDPFEGGQMRFDCIALFGVLHHVPGRELRQALLDRLVARLRPAGVLALSIWRFDRSPRFARRVIPWPDYDSLRQRARLPPIDVDQLEAGDVLLGWAGDVEQPRYCHFPDDLEIDSWIAASSPPLIDRFEADGPSGADNLYLVFQRSGRLASPPQ